MVNFVYYINNTDDFCKEWLSKNTSRGRMKPNPTLVDLDIRDLELRDEKRGTGTLVYIGAELGGPVDKLFYRTRGLRRILG